MRTFGCVLGGWVVACAIGCASETVEPMPEGAPDGGEVRSPPPAGVGPKVLATSPSSGVWGTVYTIEGEDLDRGPQTIAFATAIGEAAVVAKSSPLVVSWTRTKVEVKVPFPADGAVSLSDVPAGEFTSTFAVGKKGLMHGGIEPMAVLAPKRGELVVASTRKDGAGATEGFLYRMTADGAEEEPVTLARAVLLADANGPFAVLEDGAFAHSVLALAAPGQTPAPATGLPAAPIVGSGADAIGAYVWTVADSTMTRHRLAGGAWTTDRSVSGVYGSARTLAAADDGSLTLFTTTRGGGTFDDFDHVYAQSASAEATTFEEAESIVSDMDDSTFAYRGWTRSGGPSSVRFCATDEPGVEFDGRACFYWSRPSSSVPFTQVDFLQLDDTGTDAATAACEDDVLVITVGDGTKTKVLSPCRNVAAFTRDPDGKPALLVAYESQYHFVFAKP